MQTNLSDNHSNSNVSPIQNGSQPGLAKSSGLLVKSTVVAALGGLLFGFDTAVISGTQKSLEDVFQLDSFSLGFTVASALIGTIFGSIMVGRPSDRFGRKAVLFVVGVLYFASAVGSALAWDWYSFLFFRFIGGIGVGGASVVSPMYIAEISPARLRGRLVAITQLNVVFGILLAYLSNYLIAQQGLGAATEWRWMFGVEAFPALVFFFLLFSTPRSPRWLVSHNHLKEAYDVLKKLGTDEGSIQREIDEIQVSLDLSHHSLKEPLFRLVYRKPILLAVAIAIFNQLSGINALMYYAPKIFVMAGASKDSALLQSMVVGGTLLIFTILSMSVIDIIGRRKLMLIGSIGYILSLSTTALAFYWYENEFTTFGSVVVLISLLVFIASHAFGQGTVIWVFISEVFPNRIRARGQALGVFTHWLIAAAVSWTFPMIAEKSGGHTFAFYAAMMVLQLLWVVYVMPETKGVPLEEIQKKLGIE
ncbi:MAG: sugar porter family MFS transporter [Planctomycetes bacterium]|nr:sugar porter family MFS transporter [Planctomycetota bacterium]